MKKLSFLLLFLLAMTASPYAQLSDAVKNFISTVRDSSRQGDVHTDSLPIHEVERRLQELRLNEIGLRMELEQIRAAGAVADSLKLSQQKQSIDSLRNITPGIPVIVGKDTLFFVYAKRGGLSPTDRAESFAGNIAQVGMRYQMYPDSVYIEPTEHVSDIMYGQKVLVSVTDPDALWQNTSREQLAADYRERVISKLYELKEEHSVLRLGKQVALFAAVLLIQYLLYRLTTWLYRKLKAKIIRQKNSRFRPLAIREYELLDTDKQARILIFFANAGRYVLVFLQLLITVPILFAIFPQTEDLAVKIFSYLWNPARSILKSMVNYIPNLFTIFVIWFAIRYAIRGLKYLADEIESGKLKINGFYQDWAYPTFYIVRFLMYAFMIAMIYPYLPGSNSGVFQGISVFVGLIVSLGSSTVIGNIIAGLVITYMRPFKIGDRIKLNETTGNVIEKTAFVTRLRTPKNELVTIPNSFIMSSHTVNYSSSAREYGLIIHSEVTIGYDAPWRKVHQLLIDAAKATPGVQAEPEPFVLETALNDWYPIYQVNAFIKDADRLAQIYSDLHQNIQDQFNAAGVEIMSPQYVATRDGNGSTIPNEK